MQHDVAPPNLMSRAADRTARGPGLPHNTQRRLSPLLNPAEHQILRGYNVILSGTTEKVSAARSARRVLLRARQYILCGCYRIRFGARGRPVLLQGLGVLALQRTGVVTALHTLDDNATAMHLSSARPLST